MYDEKFTELVKVAVEKLKEDTVYQMIQLSPDYQKENDAISLKKMRNAKPFRTRLRACISNIRKC